MNADPQIIAKVMADYDKREAAKSNQSATAQPVTELQQLEYLEHVAGRLFERHRSDIQLHAHLGACINAATTAVHVWKQREREAQHAANTGAT